MQVAVTFTRSGTEQIVLDLAKRFVADGFRVTVVIPTGSESLDIMEQEAEGIGASVERVAPLYPGNRDARRSFCDLYHLFRRIRPAAVHYHVPRAFSGSESILAGYMARVPRRIRTDHNPVTSRPSRAQLIRLRAADAMVHRIVLVSTGNLANHLDRCARPASKCIVISNGIEAQSIASQCTPEERMRLRSQLSLPVDAPITVMVATLEERKGIYDYIQAARAASLDRPALHHAVIGDGEALTKMRSLAADLGIANRIHFLGRRPDVRRILGAFDVFVLPSHYEGLALTMLEALAAGLPMVATRVDGVSDVLPEGNGAIIVDRHDIGALGAAIAKLAGDPILARKVSQIAQKRVRTSFTSEAMYSHYRRLYEELGVRQ
jgi:glycosyltransferase involved in cell wall biosynthesis